MHAVGRRFAINDSVADAYLAGEAFLLNMRQGIYFQLDPVGSQIWEMLQQELSEDVICRRLLEQYAAEPSRLRTDVSEFLDCLVDHGLLDRVHD